MSNEQIPTWLYRLQREQGDDPSHKYTMQVTCDVRCALRRLGEDQLTNQDLQILREGPEELSESDEMLREACEQYFRLAYILRRFDREYHFHGIFVLHEKHMFLKEYAHQRSRLATELECLRNRILRTLGQRCSPGKVQSADVGTCDDILITTAGPPTECVKVHADLLKEPGARIALRESKYLQTALVDLDLASQPRTDDTKRELIRLYMGHKLSFQERHLKFILQLEKHSTRAGSLRLSAVFLAQTRVCSEHWHRMIAEILQEEQPFAKDLA